tara:strand:- start:23330 stop:24268 length:939 start_codon:yes stop_codon:yes gene_type:complete
VKNIERLSVPFVLSGILHLLIFSNLWHLLNLFPKVELPALDKKYQVRVIDQEELKKYRRVGVKNGAKDFSMSVGQEGKKTKNLPKINRFGENKNIDLESLAPEAKSTESIKQIPKMDSSQLESATDSKPRTRISVQDLESGNAIISDMQTRTSVENRMKQATQKQEILSQLAPQSERAQIIKNTGFNVHFEPPEGVSEDELNTAEKMFYGFQKRTFIAYLNSFVSTYQETLLKNPRLKSELKTANHLLTGKIIFDELGNIIKIQILRSSPSDEIHALFEETLKEIRKLPNPPQDLLKNRKTFTIYYQLNINR